jgi:hypothetical protein
MHPITSKPRLVLFQYKYDRRLPAFLLMHAREHASCLSQFFEVTVIDEDCDYQEICERYQPDLALFESGVPFASCRQPKIANTWVHPQVLKVGLLNADAFGEGRAGFLSDMDHWGIETFFAIATTAAEHNPEIADRLFVWPNSVDVGLYRDYGQPKNIPILFMGNQSALYPWRQQIARIVSRQYPSLISPHPGYSPLKEATQFIVGEPYARMLNASYFVPACGTVAREVVRKHFEVPACRSCLVTQRSAGLEAAGFVDMVNCVFADERNVLEKLALLFEDPDRLRAITDSGYQLVRSRHTSIQRDQVLQWFTLQKSLAPNSKIVQPDPFGALEVVGAAKPGSDRVPETDSLLGLLRQGDEKLWRGDCDAAEKLYLKCLNHYRWMPEPQLKLALCNLLKGNARAAFSWITKPIQFTLAEYKAGDPDPVEWAYFIIALLCLGQTQAAAERAGQFPWLHHCELDRVRITIERITGTAGYEITERLPVASLRRSIHRLPEKDFKHWILNLNQMLRACGQSELAQKVIGCTSSAAIGHVQRVPALRGSAAPATTYAPGMEKLAAAEFKRRLRYQKVQAAFKRFIKKYFYRLEGKYGKFVPASLARYRKDALSRAILDRCADESVRSALIIGGGRSETSTQVLVAATGAARGRILTFGINISKQRPKIRIQQDAMERYHLWATAPELLANKLDELITKIRHTHQIDLFDVLIIHGSELESEMENANVLLRHLDGSRWVVLEDINGRLNHATYTKLSEDPRFFLVDRDLNRNGYAIFERSSSVNGFEEVSALSHAAAVGTEPVRAV